jgi:hypothetical protein
MAKAKRQFDKRLLGTWRSDRTRTLKEWVWPRGLSQAKLRRARKIFGHLTIRYTPRRAYTEFKGTRSFRDYEVIAIDSSSVAILAFDVVRGERRIRHLHFEGDCYWLALGRNREWFRRVKV